VETLALAGTWQLGTTPTTTRLELAPVIAVIVLGVLLLLYRLARTARARRRKSMGAGPADHGAVHVPPHARAGTTGRSDRTGPAGRPRHNSSQPMAPSFNAPRSVHRTQTVRIGPVKGPAPAPAEALAAPQVVPSPALLPGRGGSVELPAMPAPPPSGRSH